MAPGDDAVLVAREASRSKAQVAREERCEVRQSRGREWSDESSMVLFIDLQIDSLAESQPVADPARRNPANSLEHRPSLLLCWKRGKVTGNLV